MAEPTWAEGVTVYSEYGQFQVGDRSSVLEFAWDDDAHQRHLAVGSDVVSIGTSTLYGDVEVRVEGWSTEPPIDLSSADQVVEASINLSSGLLSVMSVSSDIKLAHRVDPGWYRARAVSHDLNGGGGALAVDHGGDRYVVQLWSDAERPPELVKGWAGWQDVTLR